MNPLKFIANQTIGRVVTKIKDKISDKFENSSINKFLKNIKDIRSKGVVQSCY